MKRLIPVLSSILYQKLSGCNPLGGETKVCFMYLGTQSTVPFPHKNNIRRMDRTSDLWSRSKAHYHLRYFTMTLLKIYLNSRIVIMIIDELVFLGCSHKVVFIGSTHQVDTDIEHPQLRGFPSIVKV